MDDEDDNIASPKSRKQASEAMISAHKAEIVARRERVKEYRIQGMTMAKIAEKEGISSGMVAKDCEVIKKETAESYSEKTNVTRIGEALDSFDSIEKYAWETILELDKTKKDHHQVAHKYLDLIRVVRGDRIKAETALGFIRPQATKVDVSVNHRLQEVATPELMEKLSRGLIEAALTTDLEEPFPESDIIDAEFVENGEEFPDTEGSEEDNS